MKIIQHIAFSLTKPSANRFLFFLYIIIICFSFALYCYFLFEMCNRVKNAKLIEYTNNKKDILIFQSQRENKNISPALFNEYRFLLKNKLFLETRLQMAKTDSICFSINLSDSLIFLELRGIVIHECKITKFNRSSLFNKADGDVMNNWVSSPFMIISDISSIPKDPLLEKQAPKDTAEANKTSAVPVFPKDECIYFSLFFDKDLIIEFEQTEKDTSENHYLANYTFNRRLALLNHFYKQLLHLEPNKYIPWIKISIPQKDAKIIYRALPKHALMTLKL